MFKIYGYPVDSNDESELIELNEISIQADPVMLKEIANLLLQSAAEIVRDDNNEWDHVHLRDVSNYWTDGSPDVIVVSPNIK